MCEFNYLIPNGVFHACDCTSRKVFAVADVRVVRVRIHGIPGQSIDEDRGHDEEDPEKPTGKAEVALPFLKKENKKAIFQSPATSLICCNATLK